MVACFATRHAQELGQRFLCRFLCVAERCCFELIATQGRQLFPTTKNIIYRHIYKTSRCSPPEAGRRGIMFFLHVGMNLKSFDLSMPVLSFFCKEVNGLKLERDEGISLVWPFLCCLLCAFQRGGPSSVAR